MQSRVLAALLVASLGWGMAGVGTRFVFSEGVTTFTVIVIRILTASAAVLLVWLGKGGGITRSAWRDGAIIGVLRIGLAPMLFISSLQYVSAGVEGIFITIIPASTAALAAVALHEGLDRKQILGLGIGLVGSLLIVAVGDSGIGDDGGNVRIGAMFALGGVVAGATSGVLSRMYAPRHRTTELAIPMFLAGAVVAVVAGLIFRGVDLAGVNTTSWIVLIALGVGSTFLPFFATLFASRHTSAARVALTGYLAPVVGVVAGVVLLGEVLTVPILIGAVFALVGVAVAGRVRSPRPAVVA
ncbi:MAG: DMT family transporter [Acidimicrobiia bacterium]|nr:DMT family transporter [Acidimicrobiia bacterium]